ncbi:Uncharacterised protein [Leclercia adecarboxylata]|uniref:Uncharacterized protein n=1 Tax=Leclercia adecarboxylata TaxID=83655 RepID=A0A4V6JH52_9ENTR|nr:Uncharacterised protein [Leclercia adecarboxylata]
MAVTDNVVFELNGVSYLVSTTMDNELVIHTSEGILGDWKRISPNLDVCNVHFRGPESLTQSTTKPTFSLRSPILMCTGNPFLLKN